MISTAELEALEREVAHALRAHDSSRLRLLGHGEISLVLGWPRDSPTQACKRLPPFEDMTRYRAYESLVLRYIAALRARGLNVVDTELRCVVRPDGRVVGFHVQSAYPPDTLATEILRRSTPTSDDPLVVAVVDAVIAVTNRRLGVDAQLSNWIWQEGKVWQLDLTTPFLFDEAGRPELDLSLFLVALPAVIRPVVRRQMEQLLHRWTTARGSLLDVAANLIKEDLEGWLDSFLDRANQHVSPALTHGEAKKTNSADRRLWPLLLRLERTNRWWQQRVRHRPYEFLLPERTTYERVALAPRGEEHRVDAERRHGDLR